MLNPNGRREKNFRYRASFQKRGEFRRFTHLQLVRRIRQAMREAEIPVSCGSGSTAEPQVAFGPALPMNVESREEFLDFYCWNYMPPEELVRRINGCLPGEFAFLDATQISRSAMALSELIDGADYLIDLHSLEREDCARSLGAFEEQDHVEIVKHKTGKILNLKEFVRCLHYDPADPLLRVEMKIMEGRTIGIHSVMQKLFSTDQELPIVRERLYIWLGEEKRSPLTLEWEERQLQLHLLDFMT
jgi:radical SAM-linked protein